MNTIFPWLPTLYRKLLIQDVIGQLPGSPVRAGTEDQLSTKELRQLLAAASALSLENSDKYKTQAYEIASRLVELHGKHESKIVAGADLVLSRLGNFPGRQLLRDDFTDAPFSPPVISPILAVERLSREIRNSIEMPDGRETYLTDFQLRLFSALAESDSFSVSAPTSAGKSFVLNLDLSRRISSGIEAIVYLVPTRALIREVTIRVRSTLRDIGKQDVPVRSVPFPLARDKAPLGIVYILTQERLMSLLSSGPECWVTTLIVDEAHNIQDDARGVLLQTVIERVAKRFPAAEIHFASPLSQNPELFLQIIGRDHREKTMIETLSPVSQNLLLVSKIRGEVNHAKISLLNDQEEIPIGTVDLGFPLRGSASEQRANFAHSITGADEATIVFCNDASSSEEVALALCKKQSALSTLSQAVTEIIEFIKSDIHPAYRLIECLPHGVGYHYGNMPPLVRAKVEDLFRTGEIRFLCCTSTLLQGVNLPARHIVIDNPKKGSGTPMPRRDFLNLAGRAGRLLKEFHGNVWCLKPSEWADQCFRGPPLIQISSAFNEAMSDGGSVLQRLVEDTVRNEKEKDFAEAVFGKLFYDYRSTESIKDDFLAQWKTVDNAQTLEETRSTITNLDITLPLHLLEVNGGIRPDLLQELYNIIRAQEDLTALTPLNPWTEGHYEQVKEIIRVLEIVLRGKNNNSYKYYTWLASQWIHEKSLREIITNKLEEEDADSLSKRIRGILGTLEKEIRFHLVKNFTAYLSLLQYALEERGLNEQAAQLEPYHVYLECGAVSPNVLSLIALGVSRSTAIATAKAMRFPQNCSPEEGYTLLKGTDIDRLRIPQLCKRELQELVGRTL